MDNEWKTVLDPYQLSGLREGFSSAREYEFRRDEWDAPKAFRLTDASPYFNLHGLYYRENPNG